MTTLSTAELQDIVDEYLLDPEAVAEKYSPGQPRDEAGRFAGSFGGGGGGSLSTVDALSMGQPVRVEPRGLGRILDHAADTEQVINLEQVQVMGAKNANLYAKHLTDFSRSEMPQLPSDTAGMQRYKKFLKKNGLKAEEDDVDPRELKASQRELDASKVGRTYQNLKRTGALKEGHGTLIVSEENGIIDGHHRWAALAAYAVENPGVKVHVLRVKGPTKKVLKLSKEFAEQEGIAPRTFGQKVLKALQEIDLDEEPTSDPPDPSKPYMWFGGKWHLILQDSDEADALYESKAIGEKYAHDIHVGEMAEKAQDPALPVLPALPASSRELARIAETEIRTYTGQLAESLSQSTADSVMRAIVQARRNGTGAQGVLTSIGGLFSPDRAKRVAVTETTRLFGAGAQATYRAWGMERWRWSTCNDPWVCATCSERADKIHPMSEQFEPAHVGCRCFPRPVAPETPIQPYEVRYAQEIAGIERFHAATDEELGSDEWRAVPTAWDQLQEWARDNQIDLVDFSQGDLLTRLPHGIEKAKQIATGIADARFQIGKVRPTVGRDPDSIHWQLHKLRDFADPTTVADAHHDTGVVRINLDAMNWGIGAQERVNDLVKTGWWPKGSTPQAALVHEMGHILQRDSPYMIYTSWEVVAAHFPQKLVQELIREGLEPSYLGKFVYVRSIAQEVSIYAGRNPHEFVSETLQGLYSGNKYSDRVMLLYRMLGGPEE